MKCGATCHLERSSLVMREYKNRRVIRRLISPPAFPLIRPLWPIPAHRPKHISSENVRANILETPRGNIVVDAGLAIFVAMHPLPGARGKEPVKHSEPSNPERILKILPRPRTVTIY